MQFELATLTLLITLAIHLIWDWVSHQRIERRLEDLESAPLAQICAHGTGAAPELGSGRDLSGTKAVLYVGTAGLGSDDLESTKKTVAWNRRWFAGDVVTIGDENPVMKMIYDVAAPRPATRWYVGTLAIYAALKAFLQSDYEWMYYAKWNLLRDPREALDRRRGLCYCSLSVDDYKPTDWEKEKERTCTALLQGVECFEWDQVMGTYASLSREMAAEILEVLERGKINPLDQAFWGRVEAICRGRFYSDMLLECYTMLSKSCETGNVFDRIGLYRQGVAQGKPWIHFDGMDTAAMHAWMSKVDAQVKRDRGVAGV